MKVLKFTVLLFVLFVFTNCDYDQGFYFHNDSTRDVYIYLDAYGEILYPDTTILGYRRGVPYKKGDSFHYTYSREKGDLWIGTFSLFIFDADTFNVYSWAEIQSGYKVLQRYDISKENIKALKYTITYPPTEAMKDVKMYPPYGQ